MLGTLEEEKSSGSNRLSNWGRIWGTQEHLPDTSCLFLLHPNHSSGVRSSMRKILAHQKYVFFQIFIDI
jgi:hypothetical protein